MCRIFPFVRHHTAVTSGQTSLHVANYQGCFLGVFFFILVTNWLSIDNLMQLPLPYNSHLSLKSVRIWNLVMPRCVHFFLGVGGGLFGGPIYLQVEQSAFICRQLTIPAFSLCVQGRMGSKVSYCWLCWKNKNGGCLNTGW
jgi:hypothetical protein